jgi:hypothetical protein
MNTAETRLAVYGTLAPGQVNHHEVADLKERLQAIRRIYLPLLQNLSKNADQPIIKWPDRGPVLKKQIDKLVMLTEPGFDIPVK